MWWTLIIKYCDRPFDDVEQMDYVIIDRLNQLVQPRDTLWFLGDFCAWFGSDKDYLQRLEDFRSQINCQTIYFIYGNHDKKLRKWTKYHIVSLSNVEFVSSLWTCSRYVAGKSSFTQYRYRHRYK